MKKLYFLLFVSLFSLMTTAQSQLQTLVVGDTVLIHVLGANGTIQWQQSDDSLTWSDITGSIIDTLKTVVTSSTTTNRFYRAKITNSAICNFSSWYSTIVKYKVLSNTNQVVIGDYFHGGIVFYVDGSGNGLITTPQNHVDSAQWGCVGVSIAGANSLTDGNANTGAIVSGCSTRPIAASICDNLIYDGYSDWFLPSKEQLDYLYLHRNVVGGLTDDTCWTSTESDADNAWAEVFVNGQQITSPKDWINYRVQAVRSFSLNDNVVKIYSEVNAIQPEPAVIVFTSDGLIDCVKLSSDYNISDSLGVIVGYGTPPINYQWKLNGNIIPNANSRTLMFDSLSLADEGIYTCEVSNACNMVESDPMPVKVISITVSAGSDITFCNDTVIHLHAVATSNHPVESGTFSYYWMPYYEVNSPYSASTTAQPMSNINYQVSVTDMHSCIGRDTINVTSITPISFISQPLSQNKCLGSDAAISLSASGTEPVTYSWKKDGVALTGETTNSLLLNGLGLSDEGVYTCEISNYCKTITSDSATLNVVELTVDAGTDARLCNGQSVQLQAQANTNHVAESGAMTYTWSPSAGLSNSNISNPNANPTANSSYTVTVTDQVGCQNTDSLNIIVGNPYHEQICLVSVDTVTWKDKIMWDKTPDVGTIGYSIYKEVATNVYSGIGYLSFNDAPVFIDNSSNPDAYASRYKITVIDTCGNESPKSFYHKPINLTIATFGNTFGLNWNDYVDESGVFVPTSYYIYRGDSTSFQLIDSVPGGTNSYNDNNVTVAYYYMVAVKRTDGCNAGTKSTASLSFSNKKRGTLGIDVNDFTMITNIFPNPFTESTTLVLPETISAYPDAQLSIMDITGKTVRVVSLKNELSRRQIKIERGNLMAGVYFVEIKSDKIYRGKLVVE